MRLLQPFALFALASALPLHALDIAGYVLDKLGNPIAGAKVCVKSDAGSCVTTGTQGDFRLAKAIAVRNPGPARSGFDLAYRKGVLLVRSPSAMPARLEWLSADGRRAWAVSEVKLSAGNNPVPLPSGLPRTGVCILRLSTPDQSLAWKAVLAPGVTASGNAAAHSSPRIAALSKAAGTATLEISKAGYRTRSYEPASETETDAYIFLSPTSDVGLVFGGSVVQKVVSIDRAKKIITTQDVDAYCDEVDDTKVIRDTVTSVQNYAIRDGKLWTWVDKECVGQEFTGTASDIVGKWTLIDPNALLPEDLRSGCVQDSSANGETPFESFTAEYTISETQLAGTVTAETCPGDFLGTLFAFLFASDTAVTTTKNTCQQVVFKNGKGQSATFDFSKQGDSLRTAYAFGSATCRMDMDFGLSDKDPVCPEGQELGVFLDCVSASGFADMAPLAKTASPAPAPARPAMSLERRPAPAGMRLPTRGWFPRMRETSRQGEYISGIWKAAAPAR
jgi:hypothetical protein